MKSDIDIVIERVSKNLDIPKYEITKVVNSMCGYIFDLMEEGKWEGFYMRYLGKFIVKPKRLETIKKKVKEKMERELNSFEEDITDIS